MQGASTTQLPPPNGTPAASLSQMLSMDIMVLAGEAMAEFAMGLEPQNCRSGS